MTVREKLAGIALVAFFAWLPMASEFHSSDSGNLPARSYHLPTFGPLPTENPPIESGPPFCLLGTPHCSELQIEPVKPCLLGVERCSGEANVQLLAREIHEPSEFTR